MPMPAQERLRQWIEQSSNIVFFGGAGMSTESGIPDFRSAHGLYQQTQGKTYEEMLSIRYFLVNPDIFWTFYKAVMLKPDAKPNAGHHALTRLQQQGKLKAIVTQNIDGLHQAAGSTQVLELHGTVHRNTCLRCGKVFTLADVLAQPGTPHCDCGGILRPDIVFYGEPLNPAITEQAISAIEQCDLLIVGGTSLTVYPAAGLLNFRGNAKLALINLDQTPFDQRADLVIRDNIAISLGAAIPL